MWKMIERRNGARPEIRHVGVTNRSRRAESDRDRAFKPCALIKIESVRPEEDQSLQELYPDRIPVVPSGFRPVWKQGAVTVYVLGPT